MQTTITAKEILESGGSAVEVNLWIADAPICELEEYIRLAPIYGQQCFVGDAQATLHRKAAQAALKPHWSITPGFIVGVLAMIFAAIAAWPVIQGWIPAARHADKAASFQSPQSNSVPAKLPASKTTNSVAGP